MDHKSRQELNNELAEAKKIVKVGRLYSHYKNSKNVYKVIAIGIQEATDKICVIYQAQYDRNLVFVRDLDKWLERAEWEGREVERYVKVRS